ncbi:hypothetical protein Cgig2_010605 [Carnegiea gigantea]|uniref:Pectin acetylesterase n=1 Tax=Carnegiea gigantea TaxID=171969 RepID=A0A9Q1KSD9_9CARY|nr:hypothetical protein Cgig2_010605 [Carnegiea gigantea]
MHLAIWHMHNITFFDQIKKMFHHILVPPSADIRGHWNHCKISIATCTESQIQVLQGFAYDYFSFYGFFSAVRKYELIESVCLDFRQDMLKALYPFYRNSRRGGMFINSCFAHCQTELQDTWFAVDSPRVHQKRLTISSILQTIAEAVGNWYFGRSRAKLIDCPYPCDNNCHNLIQ